MFHDTEWGSSWGGEGSCWSAGVVERWVGAALSWMGPVFLAWSKPVRSASVQPLAPLASNTKCGNADAEAVRFAARERAPTSFLREAVPCAEPK